MKCSVSITTLTLALALTDLTSAQIASIPKRLRTSGEWGRQSVKESEYGKRGHRKMTATRLLDSYSNSMSLPSPEFLSMSMTEPVAESGTEKVQNKPSFSDLFNVTPIKERDETDKSDEISTHEEPLDGMFIDMKL